MVGPAAAHLDSVRAERGCIPKRFARSVRTQPRVQEGARTLPAAAHRTVGDAQRLGQLGVGQACEEAQLYDLRELRVVRGD